MMKTEQEECITRLRQFVRRGSTIYTICERNRSGTSGTVRVLIVRHGEIQDITSLVARACDLRLVRGTGKIRVDGCGFDRGEHVARAMKQTLYPLSAQWLRHARI